MDGRRIFDLYLVLKDSEPWHGERKYPVSRLRTYSSYSRAWAAIRAAAPSSEWGRFEVVKFTRALEWRDPKRKNGEETEFYRKD